MAQRWMIVVPFVFMVMMISCAMLFNPLSSHQHNMKKITSWTPTRTLEECAALRADMMAHSSLISRGSVKVAYLLPLGDSFRVVKLSIPRRRDKRDGNRHRDDQVLLDRALDDMRAEADMMVSLKRRNASFLIPFEDDPLWVCPEESGMPVSEVVDFVPLSMRTVADLRACVTIQLLLNLSAMVLEMERLNVILCDWHPDQFGFSLDLKPFVFDYDSMLDRPDGGFLVDSPCEANPNVSLPCTYNHCFRHAVAHTGLDVDEFECPASNKCLGFGDAANRWAFVSMVVAAMERHRKLDPVRSEIKQLIADMTVRDPAQRLTATELHAELKRIFEKSGGHSCVKKSFSDKDRAKYVRKLTSKKHERWDGRFFTDPPNSTQQT